MAGTANDLILRELGFTLIVALTPHRRYCCNVSKAKELQMGQFVNC
jgi:hypothetical protein